MVSDGCSAGFLSDWLNGMEPVYLCCVQHDTEYAMQIGRLLADWNLAVCVSSIGPLYTAIGSLMGLAVMMFGWIFYYKKAE